jgi:hypothetical protein
MSVYKTEGISGKKEFTAYPRVHTQAETVFVHNLYTARRPMTGAEWLMVKSTVKTDA